MTARRLPDPAHAVAVPALLERHLPKPLPRGWTRRGPAPGDAGEHLEGPKGLRVIASVDLEDGLWWHVSVSCRAKRAPSRDEVDLVRKAFFRAGAEVEVIEPLPNGQVAHLFTPLASGPAGKA